MTYFRRVTGPTLPRSLPAGDRPDPAGARLRRVTGPTLPAFASGG